jgi:hypothetical protein
MLISKKQNLLKSSLSFLLLLGLYISCVETGGVAFSFKDSIYSLVTMSEVTLPSNGTYDLNDNLTFTILTSEAVTITGSPRLMIIVGTTPKYADYTSGDGQADSPLTFTYNVERDLLDSDGISLYFMVDTTYGSIKDVKEKNLNPTLLFGDSSGILVDSTAPNLSISDTSFSFASKVINRESDISKTFTFTNSGTAAATGCVAASLSNSTDFVISTDGCLSNDLQIGSSCMVTVKAKPQSTGAKSTVLSRNCTNGGSLSTSLDGITVVGVNPVGWITQLGDDTLGANADGDEYVIGVVIDNSGNTYVTGHTSGSLGEARGGIPDVFTAKFDSTGSLQWLKQLGSATLGGNASGDDRGSSIAVDSSGAVYVTGVTSGSLGGVANLGNDFFIVKYSSSGVLGWIKQVPYVGNESSNDIVIDTNDNIYIVGTTNGSIGEANGGGTDVYITKFDSNGTQLDIWQLGNVTLPGASLSNESGIALTVDPSGDIIVVGTTEGSLGEANAGGKDAFVAKLSNTGTLKWIKQLGNMTLPIAASLNDTIGDVSTDSSGNIYVAGETAGSLGEASAGSDDGIVAKFDTNGNLSWVRQLGNVTMGATASGTEQLNGMVVDSYGNVYFTGFTNGALGETSGGDQDIYIAKYNTSGDFQWIYQLGNSYGAATLSTDRIYDMAIDDSNNIVIAGSSNGSLGENLGGANDVLVIQFPSYD